MRLKPTEMKTAVSCALELFETVPEANKYHSKSSQTRINLRRRRRGVKANQNFGRRVIASDDRVRRTVSGRCVNSRCFHDRGANHPCGPISRYRDIEIGPAGPETRRAE
jgi:hypothetical protein